MIPKDKLVLQGTSLIQNNPYSLLQFKKKKKTQTATKEPEHCNANQECPLIFESLSLL